MSNNAVFDVIRKCMLRDDILIAINGISDMPAVNRCLVIATKLSEISKNNSSILNLLNDTIVFRSLRDEALSRAKSSDNSIILTKPDSNL